jgi:hypothetical protein
MPKEVEPSRKVKMELKRLIKVNIIKPSPKPKNTRDTAKLFWTCEVDNCNRTYSSHSSLRPTLGLIWAGKIADMTLLEEDLKLSSSEESYQPALAVSSSTNWSELAEVVEMNI